MHSTAFATERGRYNWKDSYAEHVAVTSSSFTDFFLGMIGSSIHAGDAATTTTMIMRILVQENLLQEFLYELHYDEFYKCGMKLFVFFTTATNSFGLILCI